MSLNWYLEYNFVFMCRTKTKTSTVQRITIPLKCSIMWSHFLQLSKLALQCSQCICSLGFFVLSFGSCLSSVWIFLVTHLIIFRVLLLREGRISKEVSFLLQQKLLVMLLLLLRSESVVELLMLEGWLVPISQGLDCWIILFTSLLNWRPYHFLDSFWFKKLLF